MGFLWTLTYIHHGTDLLNYIFAMICPFIFFNIRQHISLYKMKMLPRTSKKFGKVNKDCNFCNSVTWMVQMYKHLTFRPLQNTQHKCKSLYQEKSFDSCLSNHPERTWFYKSTSYLCLFIIVTFWVCLSFMLSLGYLFKSCTQDC